MRMRLTVRRSPLATSDIYSRDCAAACIARLAVICHAADDSRRVPSNHTIWAKAPTRRCAIVVASSPTMGFDAHLSSNPGVRSK